MSGGARITLAIVTILSAIGFAAIGRLLGPELPAGSWPFYGFAVLCALIAVACLVRSSRPVTLRIIGSVVFVAYVVYAYASIGDKKFARAVAGLFAWGLPGAYVAIWGKYPWWGKGAGAFGSESANDTGMTDAEYLDWFNREFSRKLQQGGVAALSRLQRDALCIMNFQVEMNNGGIHQYLFNSSGDFARETADVLQRIGAEEAVRILEEANAYFGAAGPPADRETRVAVLNRLPKSAEDRIDALSDEFYDAEDRGLCLADLFDAHVVSQRYKSYA